MPPRKNSPPYRLGYKLEAGYPKNGGLLTPDHGCGPRCRVDYDPGGDGPWTMLRIMRVERKDGEAEEYTCAMPRCYAIPLILINKRLAFYEAQCSPDGVPHPLADGSPSVKQREMKEYTYLWRLRCGFLQAVFDMNHERCLDERWRCDKIHGYLHRVYRRYGHDVYQRTAYWRDEVKEGRVPYATPPDIADMDWDKYIAEDMASNMRLNAFVWNRISQGYSRVVKDDPPQEQWQAWRRGHRESKPSPYRTPPPPHSPSPSLSPVRELSNEIIDEERGCPGNVDDSEALVVAAATSSSSRLGDAAAPLMRCATINDDADDMCYEDALSSTAVAGPLHLQEWSIPFLMPEQSGEAVKVASASGTECLRSRQVSFRLDAPENMRLTVVRCTFSRVEDVGDDFKTKLEVAYASKCSSTQVLGSSSASSAAC